MAALYETVLDQGDLVADPTGESGQSASVSSLGEIARTIAPQFSEAVLTSHGRTKLVSSQTVGDLESIGVELQRWFIGLFDPRDANDQGRAHPQRTRFQLPLSFLLRNLDITLRYGRKVTALSPRSEQLQRRFIRSLSDELVKRQVAVEQHLAYVSDLSLLD